MDRRVRDPVGESRHLRGAGLAGAPAGPGGGKHRCLRRAPRREAAAVRPGDMARGAVRAVGLPERVLELRSGEYGRSPGHVRPAAGAHVADVGVRRRRARARRARPGVCARSLRVLDHHVPGVLAQRAARVQALHGGHLQRQRSRPHVCTGHPHGLVPGAHAARPSHAVDQCRICPGGGGRRAPDRLARGVHRHGHRELHGPREHAEAPAGNQAARPVDDHGSSVRRELRGAAVFLAAVGAGPAIA